MRLRRREHGGSVTYTSIVSNRASILSLEQPLVAVQFSLTLICEIKTVCGMRVELFLQHDFEAIGPVLTVNLVVVM